MNRIIKLIHAEDAYNQGITGAGVSVAILDTGAYPHLAIKSRIMSFQDYQKKKRRTYDDNGHGTHVMGIVGGNLPKYGFHGVAPNCLFHVYKILNASGNGKMEILTSAIWDIIANLKETKIRIINISIGVTQKQINDEYRMLQHAMDEAWRRGIVIVTAAGNNGPGANTVTLPGASKRVITVGCSDDSENMINGKLKKGYSGVGPTDACVIKPEILAPGTNVQSCGIGMPNAFAIKSGTSMAAPVVTGMIALLLQKFPHMTPDEVKLKIYQSITTIEGNPRCWGYLYVDELLK